MVTKSLRLPFLALLVLCGTPVVAQVADPSGDTSSPCADILRADVRADRATLTASTDIADTFCPYAHYFFHIDADLDGESDIALQTKFDRDGKASTTGAPRLTVSLDSALHRITWTVPVNEIETATDPNPRQISVYFRALLNLASDRLPDTPPSALAFPFDGLVSRLIGPLGGDISVSASSSYLFGASLEVPSGALVSPVAIRLNEAPDAPSFGSGELGHSSIRVEPSGLSLLLPVTLTLPYKKADLDPATSLGDSTLWLYRFDPELGVWVPMGNEPPDTANSLVVSHDVDHFSFLTLKDVTLKLTGSGTRASTPLLLLHGYQPVIETSFRACWFGDGTTFGRLPAMVSQTGVDVFELLYHSGAHIDYTARTALKDAIVRIGERAPRAPKLNIIAHSMGGLLARYYVQFVESPQSAVKVNRLLTAATPHLGTLVHPRHPSHCPSREQMLPCSDFLASSCAGTQAYQTGGVNACVERFGGKDLAACTDDYVIISGGNEDGIVPSDSSLAWTCATARAADDTLECLDGRGFSCTLEDLYETNSRRSIGHCKDSGCNHWDLFENNEGIVSVQDEGHTLWPLYRRFALQEEEFDPARCADQGACQNGVFSDDFDDGDMSQWSARLENQGFWSEHDGTMNLRGRTASFEPKSLLIRQDWGVPPSYRATYRSRPLDPSEITLRVGGFAFRYKDDSNFIGVVPLLHRTDHLLQFYLFKLKDGVRTQIGGGRCESTGSLVTRVCDVSQVIDPTTLLDWRDFNVTVSGNHYVLSIDGRTILDFLDADADFLENSKIGFMFFGGAGSYSHHIEWDDLKVSRCGAPTETCLNPVVSISNFLVPAIYDNINSDYSPAQITGGQTFIAADGLFRGVRLYIGDPNRTTEPNVGPLNGPADLVLYDAENLERPVLKGGETVIADGVAKQREVDLILREPIPTVVGHRYFFGVRTRDNWGVGLTDAYNPTYPGGAESFLDESTGAIRDLSFEGGRDLSFLIYSSCGAP